MSWKSFACLAALGAMSAPAVAAPSIEIVDNGGSATVNVITDAAGSLGAEIAITLGAGLTLVDATVNTTNFDTPNPGDNPFINGLDNPLGGDTTGLATDVGAGTIFAAYGSGDLGIGTFELLSFNYTGSGDANGSGIVAQGGSLGDALNVDADLGDTGIFGDFEPDGDVDIIDFGVFADAFGTVTGDAEYNAAADSEPDGDVDIIDFGLFADNFGIGTATAVPEPTAALLGLMGVACLGMRRQG